MKALFFVTALCAGTAMAGMPSQESIQKAKDFLDENPVFDG